MPVMPIVCRITDENQDKCIAFPGQSNEQEIIGFRRDVWAQVQAIKLFPGEGSEGYRNEYYDAHKGFFERSYHNENVAEPPIGSGRKYKHAMNQGLKAGAILYLLLRLAKYSPQDATLEKSYYVIETTSKSECENPILRQQLKSYWKKYKSVAHLWAAHQFWYDCMESDPTWENEDPLLNPDSLMALLSISEKWLDLAQVHISPHQGNKGAPTLIREQCWHTPEVMNPYLTKWYNSVYESQRFGLDSDLLPALTDDIKRIVHKYRRDTHRKD